MLLSHALHNQRYEFEVRRRRMQGILKRFRSNSPSEDGEDEEENSRLSEEERQPPAKRRKRWSDADQEGDRSLMKLFSTGRFSDVTVTAGRRRRHHQSPIPSQNNTQSTSSNSQTITTTTDPISTEEEEDDEQDFHLHRNIICLKSDFFDAACRETFKEGITRKIRIPEISPKVFSTIATWMYDGGYELPRRPPPPTSVMQTPESEGNSDIEDNNEAESKDKEAEKEDTEMTESEAAEKKISDEITAVYKAADYLGTDGLKLDILRQIKRSVLEDRSVPSAECRLKDPLSLFYNICESYQLRDWSKLREVADALAPLWYFQDDELLREAKRAANPAIVILLDAFQELVMSLFCDDCVESGLSQNISGRCCKCDVEVDFKRREGGPVEGRKN